MLRLPLLAVLAFSLSACPAQTIQQIVNVNPGASTEPGGSAAPSSDPSADATFVTPREGMRFRRISAGSFEMGSPATEQGHSEDEQQHTVTLTQSFYIQTTELTQAQWQAVMGNNPSSFRDPERPVENVSWLDAQEFIARLNEITEQGSYRLPTEAEWEYAARAGSLSTFACGYTEECLRDMAWYDANAQGQTRPVAQKQANAWGLYDMHGNVNEWVQDWKAPFAGVPRTDPTGPPQGELRVIRGGAFRYGADALRSAMRNTAGPSLRVDFIGFRLVYLP